jgi:small nuclear ribonucleoprotein (snRNP)-like protein
MPIRSQNVGSTMATAAEPRKKTQLRTLGSILRHFVDLEIKVELKTGRSYQGILVESEENLGVTLADASDVTTVCDRESAVALSFLSIRGSKIRYIHFPDDADLGAVIKQGIDRERSAKQQYQKPNFWNKKKT